MSFKHITINLSGPICDCDQMNLEWQPTSHQLGQHYYWGFQLRCLTCGAEHKVPPEKFVARYVIDRPYPGGLKPIEPPKPEPEPEPTIDVEKAEIDRTLNKEIDSFINKKLLN